MEVVVKEYDNSLLTVCNCGIAQTGSLSHGNRSNALPLHLKQRRPRLKDEDRIARMLRDLQVVEADKVFDHCIPSSRSSTTRVDRGS